jgi:hypothetical protein
MTRKLSKILAALLVTVTTAFTSCDDHPDMVDTSKHAGNILLQDNTIISPQGYDPQTMSAVGVIFAVRGDTAWAVAKDELGQYAYTDSIATVSSVTNDPTTMCGLENTSALLISGLDVPAAIAAVSYRSAISNWALPSAGELRALAAALPQVSSSMRLIGGDDFSAGQYISSSQDGSSSENSEVYYLSVSLKTGFVTSTLKIKPGIVRPVLRIQ